MAKRHQYSSGQRIGRRDVYVRSDLRPIYGQKNQRKFPFKPVLAIALVLIAVAGCAYALISGEIADNAKKPAATSAAGASGSASTSISTSSTAMATTLAAAVAKAKPAGAGASSQPAATQPQARPTVSIAAVGDLCFMDSNHNSLGSAASLLASMKPQLSAADVTLGNLEIALTSGGAAQDKTYTFRAPLSSAAGIAQSGFDVVSVANNHALDYGRDQFPAELDALHQAGLTVIGGGLNKQQAWAAQTVNRNGARIGILAFSEITPADYAATDTEPGVAYTQDTAAMTAAVAAAKASKKYDYIIVFMHWGVEGDYQNDARQTAEAHAFIDAGADAIIGSHPHRIQGVEYYKGGLIAYSLGNFVFGTAAKVSCQTMLLNFKLTDKGPEAVTATPVYIVRGSPQLATGSDWNQIATIIKSSAAHNGTTVTFANNLATFVKPQ